MNETRAKTTVLIPIALSVVALAAAVVGLGVYCIRMPGASFIGELPPLDAAGQELRGRLTMHVRVLAGQIGERNANVMPQLSQAADYIEGQFTGMGFVPSSQTFGTNEYRNISVDVYGREQRGEIIVVGAHYDTVWGTPGADDNASGVAGMLEIARALRNRSLKRTVRLIAFVNEEMPFFGGDDMGSIVSAKHSYEHHEKIVGMFSVEMIGFYSMEARSQYYPRIIRPFYPREGNFIGFVSNLGSRGFLRDALGEFRSGAGFPSEGMSAPEWLVPDVRRSDNYSYWRFGYPAVMITDTSNFRNFNYHNAGDLPNTLDYDRMTRVVSGLTEMISGLANR